MIDAAKNAEESKNLTMRIKAKNEKEIDDLPDKEESLNILYKSAKNRGEILGESTVIWRKYGRWSSS